MIILIMKPWWPSFIYQSTISSSSVTLPSKPIVKSDRVPPQMHQFFFPPSTWFLFTFLFIFVILGGEHSPASTGSLGFSRLWKLISHRKLLIANFLKTPANFIWHVFLNAQRRQCACTLIYCHGPIHPMRLNFLDFISKLLKINKWGNEALLGNSDHCLFFFSFSRVTFTIV